jgi:hypothetical protein
MPSVSASRIIPSGLAVKLELFACVRGAVSTIEMNNEPPSLPPPGLWISTADLATPRALSSGVWGIFRTWLTPLPLTPSATEEERERLLTDKVADSPNIMLLLARPRYSLSKVDNPWPVPTPEEDSRRAQLSITTTRFSTVSLVNPSEEAMRNIWRIRLSRRTQVTELSSCVSRPNS